MCVGVLSSALRHLHRHGISVHCVHVHGALHWTLDTAAALELDAESPALACAWHGTLGTTAPIELDDDSSALASALGFLGWAEPGHFDAGDSDLGLGLFLMRVSSCGEALDSDHWSQAQVH